MHAQPKQRRAPRFILQKVLSIKGINKSEDKVCSDGSWKVSNTVQFYNKSISFSYSSFFCFVIDNDDFGYIELTLMDWLLWFRFPFIG